MVSFKDLPSCIYLEIYNFLEVNRKIFNHKKNIIKSKKNDYNTWIDIYGKIMNDIDEYYEHFKYRYVKNCNSKNFHYKIKREGIRVFPTLWKSFVNKTLKESDEMYVESDVFTSIKHTFHIEDTNL